MESLQVRTGQVKLQILDDSGEPRGVFVFRPEDVHSAQQVFELQKEFSDKANAFRETLENSNSQDEQVALLNDIVDYVESAIDRIFGAGSSQILFGDAKTLSMFGDFFDGIMPYYEKASKQRMSKYRKKSGK